ncbi:MAG: DUF3168 domain-containing protein [Henriciella sp.]|nr:DUF3168 domain-containing protein [Henriciella sp.]
MTVLTEIDTRDADLIEHILSHLRADAAVQELLGSPARVFDDESRAALYPYIVLEKCERRDAGAAGVSGAEYRLQFASRSRTGGQAEAKRLLATVRGALQRVETSLARQHIVLIHPTYSDVMRAPNRQTLRGVLRVRIITEGV